MYVVGGWGRYSFELLELRLAKLSACSTVVNSSLERYVSKQHYSDLTSGIEVFDCNDPEFILYKFVVVTTPYLVPNYEKGSGLHGEHGDGLINSSSLWQIVAEVALKGKTVE